ncbi:virion core protein, T7 gp14 family [Dongia sedimenti]|uniref:Uncharacterized protein n=1 Tax=Dongia sedimenti TaxID=3064282 RepID=A0ABU0YET7_9PROT|nr:hypothetical protein [Rhodospirillaceae bacterium R-7]
MTWVPIAAAAVQAVGSVVSGVSQYSQAKSQAAYAQTNAGLAEQQAESQAQAIREKARRLSGQNRAAIGASGVDLAGSFLDALADSDIDAELDAQTALWNGKVEAANYRAQAEASKAAGSSALVGGLFGAGTSAISGYANWYDAKARDDIRRKLTTGPEGPSYGPRYPSPNAHSGGF